MNYLKSTSWIMLFLCLLACNSPQPEVSSSQTTLYEGVIIPDLLQRHQGLENGKEWEEVQRAYVKYRIAAQSGDREALLYLTQLFINEARVSGEHGHYYPAGLKLLQYLAEDTEVSKDLAFRGQVTKAVIQLALHDFEAALETGKSALELNPYNSQVYGVLVDAYVETGQYEQAVEMADQMIAIKPDLRSYARISYLREIHGMDEAAIEAMQMAVEASVPGYEESAWVMLQFGGLLEKAGKTNGAKQVYQQILKERPEYPFATAALANLMKEAGDYDQAKTMLLEAIEVIPEVGFYMDLAIIYEELGDLASFDATLESINTMLSEDEESGHNMNLERALVYATLAEDFEMAHTYAEIEYKKRPDNIDVNVIMAKIYALQGDANQAQYHLEKASKTGMQHPDIQAMIQMT